MAAELTARSRRWNALANVRLLVGVLVIAAIWLWWQQRTVVWGIASIIALAAFLLLVVVHARLRRAVNAGTAQLAVIDRAIARQELRWDDVPLPPDAGVGPDHPYAFDLNILGRASVAQRIGTPVTRPGWTALYQRLLDPHAGDVTPVQAAVRELAAAVDVREAVQAANDREDASIPDPAELIAWAEQRDVRSLPAWLQVVRVVSPLAVIALLVLWFAGAINGPWFALPVALNAIVVFGFGGRYAADIQTISGHARAISVYRAIFRQIGRAPAESGLLRRITARIGGEAAGRMDTLATIAAFVVPPSALIYIPLQLAFLWDLQVSDALARWTAASGSHVRDWLAAVGEWEALAALSTLHHDHPGWAFPNVSDQHDRFRAEGMAHPLLETDVAVANDVDVGPVGSLLFVTGSNMSGKSTLLRTIGANAVLAKAGAPVCASACTMPWLSVWTCMRVEDSLERGVSLFMAELRRLKLVVDGASAASDVPALYLLDEILQGTNTGERQIASRLVLERLVKANAFGAVSSHDLQLLDDTVLQEHAVAVHFAETWHEENGQSDMAFDYRLRPGLATTSNALRLMELLGFDVGETKTTGT